jgi:heme exporter protein C
MKDRFDWLLGALAAVMLVVALYLTFVWVPTEFTMGIVQRIFYFHVPPFFVAVVAIFVGMIAGIRFLITRDFRFDEVAVASIEVGMIFDTMNLITGPFWARPVWGIWWTWDARLTSAFVLWLMFIGYLILRQAVDDPTLRAVVSAVLAIFQAVASVVCYMAIRWWRTQHPQPVIAGGEGSGLDPSMRFVLWFSFAALMVLYLYLLGVRRRLERLRRETEGLRRTVHSL